MSTASNGLVDELMELPINLSTTDLGNGIGNSWLLMEYSSLIFFLFQDVGMMDDWDTETMGGNMCPASHKV